jgi:hypothetical protein
MRMMALRGSALMLYMPNHAIVRLSIAFFK